MNEVSGYGRLTILSVNGKYASCICSCGSRKDIYKYDIYSGRTLSCGCLRKELTGDRARSHGMTDSDAFKTWRDMRKRCNNPRSSAFHRYGGRGITICSRWDKFENFLSDMGDRPKGYEIDRIDNDGNYEPSNCHWVTKAENARNRSCRNKFGLSGISKPHGLFYACLAIDGVRTHLGSSVDFFEICCIRKSAENKYWRNV